MNTLNKWEIFRKAYILFWLRKHTLQFDPSIEANSHS